MAGRFIPSIRSEQGVNFWRPVACRETIGRSMSGTAKFAVACFCFAVLLHPFSAQAQVTALPAWMKVSSLAFEGKQSTETQVDLQREALKKTRRSAYLIAAGIGLIAAGTFHAAAFGQKSICSPPQIQVKSAIPLGVTTAAAGLVMTIFGIRKRESVPPNMQRVSPGDPPLLVLTSLATATVAEGLLFATALPKWLDCLNY